MKIEKVNDHQIRCTLTREDLADRELKLSELAYGTEKAKDLFRDMMQQASYEFGFEAEDIPLMIEAIPLNSECIVLIITKVEDPEELDTRFSKFAPSVYEESEMPDDVLEPVHDGADDILDLFRKIQSKHGLPSDIAEIETTKETASDNDSFQSFKETLKKQEEKSPTDITRIYTYKTLHEVSRSARILAAAYSGENSLYKTEDSYILVLSKGTHTPAEFSKICSILSEYATPVRSLAASEAYLEEHYEPIIKNTALQSLSCI